MLGEESLPDGEMSGADSGVGSPDLAAALVERDGSGIEVVPGVGDEERVAAQCTEAVRVVANIQAE